MRSQCPECRTVTGGSAGFCGSCGYQFFKGEDKVRQMAAVPKSGFKYDRGIAVLAGLAIAVVQYMLRR